MRPGVSYVTLNTYLPHGGVFTSRKVPNVTIHAKPGGAVTRQVWRLAVLIAEPFQGRATALGMRLR